MRNLLLLLNYMPQSYSQDRNCERESVTWNALVGSFQVRLEVLLARLSDRVHGGDQQRAILSSGAEAVQVLGDVAVASQCVSVVGRDTAAGRHAAVQRTEDDNHVISVTARRKPLINTVLTCLQ